MQISCYGWDRSRNDCCVECGDEEGELVVWSAECVVEGWERR